MQLLKGLTKKQFEFLIKFIPQSDGEIKSIYQIAVELDISTRGVNRRKNNIKKKYPFEFAAINGMRKSMKKHRRQIKKWNYWKPYYEHSHWQPDFEEYEDKNGDIVTYLDYVEKLNLIKEKF